MGVTQITSYAYNLDGSIATATYPSTKVITYTVSNAQRLTAAKDVANNIQFATAASYSPPGGLNGMITGQISGGFGGITESHTYNNSLEYTSTLASSSAGTAMNLTLTYNPTASDNGSVTGVTNNADSGRTQSFTYDPLNRILSAKSSATSGVDCWGQNFGPDGAAADDAVANLTKINNGTQTPPPCTFGSLNATVDANNHINTDSTYATDAAGNMYKDGSGTGWLYTFDAENRLTLAAGPSGGPYCYVYDGLGLRVAKKSSATTCTSGTVTKLYWRGIGGDALAESDSTGSTTNAAYVEYVFFAGRRVASRNGTGAIFYYFADQLGSTRTITTGSGPGQTPGQLCYDADFTPYGQEVSYTARLQTTACPPSYKFTGYERDSETGLDYAFARYYSSRLGRFLSTDPLGGSIGDLQSHNAYAYTGNNPLNFVDPFGLREDMPGQCPQVSIDGVAVYGSWDGGCGAAGWLVRAILSMEAGAIAPEGVQIRWDPVTSQWQQWVPTVNWTTGDDTSGYTLHQIIGGWATYNTVSSGWFSLRGFSDFFAGAGDCLTGRCLFLGTSATEWIRQQNGADSVVNKASDAYLGGEITGGAVGAAATTLAVANATVGLETKVALHGAHHAFEWLGGARLAHLQFIFWIAGQKGSDISARLPLPWK